MQRPPACYLKNGRWFLVRKGKWHPLSRDEDGPTAFWEAYYRLTQERPTAMAGLLLRYLEEGTAELRAPTLREYRRAILTRLIPTFGHMPIGTITSGHVAQYLEGRKQAGASVAGNREKSALSSAISWGMRQGMLNANPCYGVRRNRERPSRRYVEHEELRTALDRAPVALRLLMSAAYLTGLRLVDLRELRKEHVVADGLWIDESKTGKMRLVTWTPVLRQVIEEALARSSREEVFVTARGLAWSESALQSAMKRLAPGFAFRELRPKAASDAEHNVLGHAAGMLARYKRREKLRPVH